MLLVRSFGNQCNVITTTKHRGNRLIILHHHVNNLSWKENMSVKVNSVCCDKFQRSLLRAVHFFSCCCRHDKAGEKERGSDGEQTASGLRELKRESSQEQPWSFVGKSFRKWAPIQWAGGVESGGLIVLGTVPTVCEYVSGDGCVLQVVSTLSSAGDCKTFNTRSDRDHN